MNYYKRHSVANMTLPAITIGASENVPLEDDRANWSTDLLTNHSVILAIRIHTAFAGNALNREDATLFADQVIQELKTNITLGLYRLMRFEVTDYNTFFEESETFGSEILVEYHTAKVYEQV